MSKENLKKKIDEAIASKTTTEVNKKLLIEILKEFKLAKTEKDFNNIILKLIEIIGVCNTVYSIFGSG